MCSLNLIFLADFEYLVNFFLFEALPLGSDHLLAASHNNNRL